jgi:hypothetical protein
MKDLGHHPKSIQKKILQQARKESMDREESPIREKLESESPTDRLHPEYEGERFDPHHRKPRILKRMKFH